MTELKQRAQFTKKEFYLEKTGVKVVSKTLQENLEYTIKYEELGFEQVKKQEKGAMIGVIFFGLLLLLDLYLLVDALINGERLVEVLMWAASAVFFGFLTVFALQSLNKEVVYLTGGTKVLELFRSSPSKGEVDNFIAALYEQIKCYYKNKFGNIEPHLSREVHLARFEWLMEMGYIDEEEHEYLVFQLQLKDLLT
ncbi:hypothetical protein [Rufibacter aurantiacus]|uniref:hypothetical protein n=1 Tax=Rufibacter aurantiacus TaxID=2817374 RepID=UPI001B30FD25|nr:hypothetical protein [Rufibacter aurantiacus]